MRKKRPLPCVWQGTSRNAGLQQDLCQLVDRLVEHAQRAADGVGLGEVDACDLELFERIIAAAGREELQIAACVAGRQDMLGDGHGGGEAGRVLIDVERAVEVGDIRPFGVDVRVDADAVIIGGFEIVIDLVERCGRQRLARSVEIVRLALELCEQRLPVERRAEALEEVVEDVCAALFVRLGLQQILGQQDLVDRRGDLGDHDAVIVVDIILRRIGEPGVHGVAQLMRQRERVAQRPGIVHQHIRMHAEHTARERAGLLAVVLIHVDPAFGERAVQQLLVFLAQRQRRLLDQLHRV